MILLAIVATVWAALWMIVVLFANGMASAQVEFKGGGTIVAFWLLALFFWAAVFIDRANGAELYVCTPRQAEAGECLPYVGIMKEESATLGAFGTYSTNYMHRRWERLCKGGGRYQAMSEAYERGRPNPCR